MFTPAYFERGRFVNQNYKPLERSMIRNFFAAVLLVLSFATSAIAQSPMITTSRPNPVVMTEGMSLKVQNENLRPIPGASIVVSLMRYDGNTGDYFVDLASSRKFEACKKPDRINCVRSNGVADISLDALPEGDGYGVGTDYDVRAEAPGYYHGSWNMLRVFVVKGLIVTPQPIFMSENGMKVDGPYIWWTSDKDFVVGVYVRSDWFDRVNMDYDFSGSGYTKAMVKYGTISIGESTSTEWKWVEREFQFVSSPSNMSYYQGGFCAQVQLRSPWANEWTETTEKACLPVRKQ